MKTEDIKEYEDKYSRAIVPGAVVRHQSMWQDIRIGKVTSVSQDIGRATVAFTGPGGKDALEVVPLVELTRIA